MFHRTMCIIQEDGRCMREWKHRTDSALSSVFRLADYPLAIKLMVSVANEIKSHI